MSHHKHHKQSANNIDGDSNINIQSQTPPITSEAAQSPFATEPVAPEVPETVAPVEAALPVSPEPATTLPIASQPMTGAPKKKKKVGLIVGIIVASVLVVLGTSAALVYALWYQNPEKVVLDAVTNAIKANAVRVTGEFELKNSGSGATGIKSMKLKLSEKGNIATYDMSAELELNLTDYKEPLTLKGGSILTDNGDIYIRLDGLKNTLDAYIESLEEDAGVSEYASIYGELYKSLGDLIEKVDGQWWRISAKELSENNEEYSKVQECVTKVAKQLESDSTMRKELADLYGEYKFITIEDKLGEKDGNLGYKIEGDTGQAEKFVKGLKGTSVYKALNKCDDRFKISDDVDFSDDSEAASDTSKVAVELWVSKFGHEIVEVKMSGKDEQKSGYEMDRAGDDIDYASGGSSITEFSASFKPVFNQPSEVKAPSDFKSITELIEMFQELYAGLYDVDYTDFESDEPEGDQPSAGLSAYLDDPGYSPADTTLEIKDSQSL